MLYQLKQIAFELKTLSLSYKDLHKLANKFNHPLNLIQEIFEEYESYPEEVNESLDEFLLNIQSALSYVNKLELQILTSLPENEEKYKQFVIRVFSIFSEFLREAEMIYQKTLSSLKEIESPQLKKSQDIFYQLAPYFENLKNVAKTWENLQQNLENGSHKNQEQYEKFIDIFINQINLPTDLLKEKNWLFTLKEHINQIN